jgi:hypothetical protein
MRASPQEVSWYNPKGITIYMNGHAINRNGMRRADVAHI